MRVFVDTNVWVYAADHRDLAKQQQALAVVRSGAGSDVVVSAQVLGEFFDVTTRKLAERVATDDAQALVSEMAQLPVVPVDVRLVLAAIAGAAQWQLSYWDALIVAAAETSGCDVVLSEDLAHGRRYGSVRIENPFLSADERPESGG
jgi:predicted nucleic acid-binding protein